MIRRNRITIQNRYKIWNGEKLRSREQADESNTTQDIERNEDCEVRSTFNEKVQSLRCLCFRVRLSRTSCQLFHRDVCLLRKGRSTNCPTRTASANFVSSGSRVSTGGKRHLGGKLCIFYGENIFQTWPSRVFLAACLLLATPSTKNRF